MTGGTRLVVVSAGVRRPSSTRRLADLLAGAAHDALAARGAAVSSTVLELSELGHEVLDRLLAGRTGPALGAAADALAGASAVVAVTPVFTASYSGLFKMFFDVLDPGTLRGTPVLMGATAGVGRHSLALDHALRPLFACLRMPTVPTAVLATPEDWAGDGLLPRAERAAAELAGMVPAAAPVPLR